ncbi:MAG: DNA repair and recombination protein RadA [Candidatus Micrarchaeota archaeon]|nr:DNA repair and recombination protein RadA [Candidatus Micrarchaeota archaeon]
MAKEVKVKEIEDLPGIGPTSAQKLRDNGYDTLDKVASALVGELADKTGISTEVAKKAIDGAKAATTLTFQTGTEAYDETKSLGKISTGAKSLDDLIGGGVEVKAITEVYGRFASGKSQIGFTLTVNAQLPREKGGLDGAVLFIDTEGTFSPERIESIAKGAGLDPKQVLENIFLIRAQTTEQQVLAAERADKLIKEKNIKLIVVDSITSLFRAEFLGRGTLNERQQKLNAHIHRLQMLADTHNIAVYITNQVMDNPGMLFGDPTTPIGGNILAHAAKTRLYTRKGKEDKRIVRLVDSPNMPEGEAVIKITTDGIKD